jgi:hypothetical protein
MVQEESRDTMLQTRRTKDLLLKQSALTLKEAWIQIQRTRVDSTTQAWMT